MDPNYFLFTGKSGAKPERESQRESELKKLFFQKKISKMECVQIANFELQLRFLSN